ncbi:hypothetical protein PFLmoz3_00559 [Pseudomonas fluorescens]|uniref:Uncharacterized protein n=1 Tax=Pseudomonas fluorescens TaxID=294 RepID=A0A120G941_PSEFL|nr:hypothetical protein PFLmoz3_00559 [Pseudomonas fluorescens]
MVGRSLPGAFGAMVGLKTQALHRLIPQACTQAFAQLFPRQGLLRAVVEQVLALRHEHRQVLGHQAHTPHRRGDLYLLQAPTGQFEQH